MAERGLVEAELAHGRGGVAAADDRQARRSSISACATARVPPANASVSNTPIGPFQKTVLASDSAAAKAAADSGPMSRPRASAGISEAGTTDGCGSRSPDGNAVSTTTSVGSTISTPRSAASLR